MGFEYVSVEEAIARRGLRMVVVGQVPSPWGEAAKGIFHVKGLDFVAVRLVYDDPALAKWAGQLSGPVVFHDDEPPRSGWCEILMLAERLAPAPALLPSDPTARAQAVMLADRICGQDGLAWNRRLQMVHAGLTKTGGFPERVAGYLAGKYGYDASRAEAVNLRVQALLAELAQALHAARAAGRDYYLGDQPSAVDIYSAACMAVFKPLSEDRCAMSKAIRTAFEWLDEPTGRALDPILLEHRDRMFARHLALPLSL